MVTGWCGMVVYNPAGYFQASPSSPSIHLEETNRVILESSSPLLSLVRFWYGIGICGVISCPLLLVDYVFSSCHPKDWWAPPFVVSSSGLHETL